MERRHFFRNFAVGGSLLLTAPVLFNSCSGDDDSEDNNNNNNTGITVDLASAEFAILATVGKFAYKGDIIIIRSTETVYIALSKLCTHSDCTVTYNSTTQEIPCPCHGSKFTKEGAVVTGPATKPLKKYNVTVNGNILTIS